MMGDSEAESINWYDSLPDKEDEREGAVSKDGGGQGGVGRGRSADSGPGCRTESTYRSRARGGGAHHAVTAADAGHRFRARPSWPQLPLGHCQKQGAGTVKGAPRGEAKGSEECPKLGLKREESKPCVSRDQALARVCLEQHGGGDTKQAESWKGPWTAITQTQTASKLAHIHAEGRT